MRRTQLFLDEDTAQRLAAESERRGTTVSALVREAIATVYGKVSGSDRQGLIRELSGAWNRRPGLESTGAHVRRLRRSTRADRWKSKGG